MTFHTRASTFAYGLRPRAPAPVLQTRDPTSADVGYDVGTLWINQATNTIFVNTNPGVWM